MTANTLTSASTKVLPLLGRSLSELTEWVVSQGQPSYRGKQLHDWLYNKGAVSYTHLTLPTNR